MDTTTTEPTPPTPAIKIGNGSIPTTESQPTPLISAPKDVKSPDAPSLSADKSDSTNAKDDKSDAKSDVSGHVSASGGLSASKWLGFGLPFRPVRGTYQLYQLSDIGGFRAVDSNEFAYLLTTADVRDHKLKLESKIISPTGCEIVGADGQLFDGSPYDTFYRDSQSCAAWAWDRVTGGVFAYVPLIPQIDRQYHCVAPSLAEFFARLSLECEISWAIDLDTSGEDAHKLFLLTSESAQFAEVRKLDITDIWHNLLPKHLQPTHIAYLEPFYQSYRKNLPTTTTPTAPTAPTTIHSTAAASSRDTRHVTFAMHNEQAVPAEVGEVGEVGEAGPTSFACDNRRIAKDDHTGAQITAGLFLAAVVGLFVSCKRA